MDYSLIYRHNARLNVKTAKAWYKQQRDGLQKDFATSVKEAIIRKKLIPRHLPFAIEM